MISFVRKSLRRRKLRLVVKALPHLLLRRYGRQDVYTAGQVGTTANLLKIEPALMPDAYAVGCSLSEFLAAQPNLRKADYLDLRRDIARLFWLDEPKLNCRTLTSKFRNPISRAHLGRDVVWGSFGESGGNGGGSGGGGD